MKNDHAGSAAGTAVWVTTKEGWIRGDQITSVRFRRSGYKSYGKEVSTYYVSITQLGAAEGGGPSTFTLWNVEGGDGKGLARAAISLMEFISGAEPGVVVYQEGKAKLVSFTEALLAAAAIAESAD